MNFNMLRAKPIRSEGRGRTFESCRVRHSSMNGRPFPKNRVRT